MKKSLAIVLVVLLSLILAVSCGKKEETKATTAPSTTTTTTTTVTTPASEPKKTAEAPKVEPTPAPVVEKAAPKKMVYATSSFGMKFSVTPVISAADYSAVFYYNRSHKRIRIHKTCSAFSEFNSYSHIFFMF